jgi:hypothetical protein
MSGIEQAIHEFRQERLKIYRIAPTQLTRDANSANETARDHVGRWIYELIQNSDDAQASELLVSLKDDAIYVADNGKGLASDTIKSLSGTHLSIKPAGSIGRKGLGFKSVYAITQTPEIYSHQDGLIFSPEMAACWLREQGIATSKVPYQWLPFYQARDAGERCDEVLASLRQMRTIVKLPLASPMTGAGVIESLRALPAYILLTFRHLRKLDVIAENSDKSFSVRMTRWPESENEWNIVDTRDGQPQHWRLAKLPLNVPPEALVEFEDEDDKRRAADVSVAIATLLNEEGQVTSLPSPMNLHVYYPTEEPSPIPALLHGDFIVKSDRTKIVSDSRFNGLLSRSLASHVVSCIAQWYSESDPAANLRLLLPTDSFSSSVTSANLWAHIEAGVKANLKLPDANGRCILPVDGACRIATSVAPELARDIFAKCGYSSRLVHPSLEKDAHVRRVLDKFGCTKLTDDDLFALIATAPSNIASDVDWTWSCWNWIAAWAKAQREHDWKPDARNKRLLRLRKTPILSVGGNPVSIESVGAKIVTWREGTLQLLTPEWIPLAFIDDWLRDRVLSAPPDSSIHPLLTEFSVEQPNQKLLLKALELAISDFWQTKQGDGGRFLAFLATSNFHEQFDASETLQHCPIRATIEGKPGEFFVEARSAYFGMDWGEVLLADAFKDTPGVKWAKRPDSSSEEYRKILIWLGVANCPRLIPDYNENAEREESWRVSRCLPTHTAKDDVASPLLLDGIEFGPLNPLKARAVLHLLAGQWRYYSSHVSLSVGYKYYSWYQHSVPALWWEQLKSKLIPPLVNNYAIPAALGACWLPDKMTRKTIGPLLPIIDISGFGDDSNTVENWLIQHVGVRTQLSQIRVHEWRELLTTQIPKVISLTAGAADGAYQKVAGWYEACLESLATQESESSLSNAPLLCRKGEAWDYVVGEPRWLADNNELAHAFRAEVWQILFPERLHSDARKYFGLMRLSDAREEPCWDSFSGQGHTEFQKQLDSIKPYIFIWRCYKTKQDHEQLRGFLQKLSVRVADTLQAFVILGHSVQPKLVERQAAVTGDILLLKQEKAGLPLLAEAIALAVRTPTDSDFYENLLRCDSDAERMRKLEARNCPPEQIGKLLHEYFTSSEPQSVETRNEVPTEIPHETTGTPQTSKSTKEDKTRQSAAAVSQTQTEKKSESKAVSVQHTSNTTLQDTTVTEGTPATSPAGASRPQSLKTDRGVTQLKEAGKGEFEVRAGRARERRKCSKERKPTTAQPEAKSQNLPESEIGFESLTQAEKAEIDRRAKDFAALELQKPEFGYTQVHQMASQSPGYDLRAEKGDETLRVEVKGHLKAATKVFVTKREWKEYSRQTTDNRWELWNVEFLAADAGQPVRITRYSQIPNYAVEVSGLWIELADCSFKDIK